MVYFHDCSLRGIVIKMDPFPYLVTIAIIGDYTLIKYNELIEKSHKSFSIDVSFNMIGNILNGFGDIINLNNIPKNSSIKEENRNIFSPALNITHITPLRDQILTGIRSIDWMIPIAWGQKQAIIGDAFTGKTTFAVSTMLNLKDEKDVINIYVSIGQKKTNVSDILQVLEHNKVQNYIIIVADASDEVLMSYYAPYVAMTIAEYFRDHKKKVAVFIDSITNHASAYRTLSILMRRPLGRDAFPGDIFSIHSTLLERAGSQQDQGKGAITVFPIDQTVNEDLGYLTTNIISITDGQIIFSVEQFNKGIKPAVNLNLSVSRIGKVVQKPLLRELTNDLKIILSKYKDYLKTSFVIEDNEEDGTNKTTDSTQNKLSNIIDNGKILNHMICQKKYELDNYISYVILLAAFQENKININNMYNISKYMLSIENAIIKYKDTLKEDSITLKDCMNILNRENIFVD